MIQLQHIDANGQNLGGLYVCPSEIAAVYAVRIKGFDYGCIVLKSGRDFRTAQTVSDLLDMMMANAEAQALATERRR
jgi:hypothetical protein